MRPSLLGALVAPVTGLLGRIGEMTLFSLRVVTWTFRPPFRPLVFIEALHFVGIGSLSIISLVAAFVGAVLALQTVAGFARFDAEGMVGGVIALSFSREMAPVFTALMLTARAGSAMATELGTMRVTDQIDALVTMGISPIQYLVAPRFVACVLMAPFLCLVFDVVGVGAAYVICVHLMDIDPGIYQDTVIGWVEPGDVIGGLVKATVLSGFVALVACFQGFHARGGAAGVGEATTRAVVHGFVSVFVVDYLVTSLLV